MELREIYKGNKLDVIEELSEGSTMTLTASFVKTGVKNLNGRTYGEDIIKKEIKRLNTKIQKEKSILSGSGHPKRELEVPQVSHQIQAMWFDEETKEGKCTIEIIPTQAGKDTMVILKAGGSLGISMRGRGKVDKEGNIKSDYSLEGCDIVTSPSFGDVTRFNKGNVIGESFDLENSKVIISEQEKVKRFMKKIRELYLSDRNAGMRKMSLKEFAEKFSDKVEKLLEDEE